jgi:hypothetical protein
MIFNSNYSPYLINLNASANQVVNNWSVNGVGYSGGNYNLSRIVNISFGSNSFVVCGTNVNGTDCDSVVVTLVNSSVVINTTLFIDIISPIATTYDDGRILLNISSNGTNVWYNYNGTNITYNGILFLNLEEGDYNLMAWANNSTGAIVFDSVNFSVDFNNGDDDDEDCNGCNDCEPVEDGSIFIDNQNETVLVLGDSLPASGDNGQMGLGTLMLILLGGIILIMIVILVVVLARVLS